MKFNLIICTYKRSEAIDKLLKSLVNQTKYPDEVLVIDSSPDEQTKELLNNLKYPNLKYFKVDDENRGLTKQRNFGVQKSSNDIDVICFLDDDIILEEDYFEKLIYTYEEVPDAYGVGGYIKNEVEWFKKKEAIKDDEYQFEGWFRKLGSRNYLRKRLGMISNYRPGVMPEFSHGLSVSFLPPTGKIYPVEYFMGGVSSYRKSVFEKVKFSEYFEGYGLYEDMDFCLRISKIGSLYLNTGARVVHNHYHTGRPNRFKYGKMVMRNGWYVWRIKYPHPSIKARVKWHSVGFLLTLVRFSNVFTKKNKMESLTETLGRFFGWISLFLKKPGNAK